MPKVSVIIPTFNRDHLISRAIKSVLNQTYRDFEIIVIDDGSTDNTKGTLKTFNGKVRYFYQQNAGISGARNRGITEAKGEYLAFLDSDDEWAPEKLAVQVGILDKNNRVGIVYSKMIILDENGKNAGFKPEEPTGRNYLELIEIRGDIATSTVMTRRECFEKAGMFDPDLPPMEDFDMWLRIAKHYEINEIENPVLAFYHEHSQQATRDPFKVYEGLVKLESKILRTADTDNVPREIRDKVIKRLTMHQYTLSRMYYREGRLRNSFQLVSNSIALNPSVGLLFMRKDESVPGRLVKWIKPYGFWVLCSLKNLFSKITRCPK